MPVAGKMRAFTQRLIREAGLIDNPVILPTAVYAGKPGAVEITTTFTTNMCSCPQRDKLRQFLQENS
jgi:hypothetical protein